MNAADVAIATITLVRSAAEEALLRRSLLLLGATGMPIAVADGGSGSAFAEFVRGVPGAVMATAPGSGLVAQVQASLQCSATFGRRYVLYTEPDKEGFFEHHLHRFVEQAVDAADTGVVIAARSAPSLETFPPMQRYVESVVNHLC